MYQIERETEREEKCKAVALVPNSVGNFSQIDDNFLHLTKMGIGPNHFVPFVRAPQGFATPLESTLIDGQAAEQQHKRWMNTWKCLG